MNEGDYRYRYTDAAKKNLTTGKERRNMDFLAIIK